MSDSNDEVHELRAKQSRAVMPMIGPLLDAWDGLPNDMKDLVREDGLLGEWLDKIDSAMEGWHE